MLNGAQQRATGNGGITGGARREGEEVVMLAFCLKLFLIITSARTTIIEPHIPDLVENSVRTVMSPSYHLSELTPAYLTHHLASIML